MLPSPFPGEIQTAIFDILVELVIVLAVPDEFIGRAVDPHKSIQRGTLQTRDLANKDLIEPVVYVFILLLLHKATLQGQGLADLPPAEQRVQVEPDATAAAGNIIG